MAGLVLKGANIRGDEIEVVEWPGGEPIQIDLDMTPQAFVAVKKGRMTVTRGKHLRASHFGTCLVEMSLLTIL